MYQFGHMTILQRKNNYRREEESPGDDCKLREATSRRLPQLSIKVREHCYQLLSQALADNALRGREGGHTSEEAAITGEHEVFRSAKSVQVYKLRIHKKVSEVRQCTQRGEPHPLLSGDDPEPHPLLSGDDPEPHPLLSGDDPEPHPLLSRDDPAPKSPLDRSDKLPGDFVRASELVRGRKESADLDTPAPREMETERLQPEREDKLRFTSDAAPAFVPASRLLAISSVPESPRLTMDVSGGNRDAPSCLLHEQSPGTVGSQTRAAVSCRGDRGEGKREREESRKKRVGGGGGRRGPDAVQQTSIITGFFDKTQVSTNGPPSGSLAAFPLQVLASKNSVVGLDETPAPAASVVSGRKRKLADIVVRSLDPYYKTKKIASKELFKKLARKICELVLSHEHSGDRDVEKGVKKYFETFGKFNSDSDLRRLDKIFQS